MKNRNLKWYHYTAKVILISIMALAAPIFILLAMADGKHPLMMYYVMWDDSNMAKYMD